MVNNILIGLSALAALTGTSSNTNYPMTEQDYQAIATTLGISVYQDEDGFSFLDVAEENAVYSIHGENRYYEVVLKNGGYAIYDKMDEKVVEYSLYELSPYSRSSSELKIFFQEENKTSHIVYENDNFYTLDQFSSKSIYNVASMSSSAAGVYNKNINPGSDAVLIPNHFYFEKLEDYHGTNDENVCSLVSVQMLFGYLDSFYNDDIVEEQYDLVFKTREKTSAVQMFELPKNNTDGRIKDKKRMEDFLVTFEELALQMFNHPLMDGYKMPELKELVKEYMKKRGISYSWNVCDGNWADQISNYAKKVIRESIDAGLPVISNGTGHSTVAYGYDENYVYVHTGWGYIAATSWDTYTTSWAGNKFEAAAISLIINSHRHSDNFFSSGNNEYYCPDGHIFEYSILDAGDYGFKQEYNMQEETKVVYAGTLPVTTKRLRTGCIETYFINLSSRKENVSEAYIEYHTETVIKKIEVKISFWSANERFFSGSKAVIEYLDSNGNWVQVYNLLNDINLSTDRTNPDIIQICFPDDVYAFRFYASNEAVGDRNKGRISIGRLFIMHD
ncbi:MAG: C10 family peptidase [Anaeroplasmataceae bacterium]|nr:C10 family peptidase [Anaeroplasmataceae bacterium]